MNNAEWIEVAQVTICEHLKDCLVTGFHTSSHFIDQLFSYQVSRRVLYLEVTHMYVIAQFAGLINKILNTNVPRSVCSIQKNTCV